MRLDRYKLSCTGPASLINYKRRHSNCLAESKAFRSQEPTPPLSATSGGVRSFPSQQDARPDSKLHFYRFRQKLKLCSLNNPIKYLVCFLFLSWSIKIKGLRICCGCQALKDMTVSTTLSQAQCCRPDIPGAQEGPFGCMSPGQGSKGPEVQTLALQINE